MNPKWTVKAVTALDDYVLLLTFESGEQKTFDCKPLFGRKLFEPLKNKGFFSLANTDGCTVVWNDQIDIAPETLYEKGVPYRG